MTDPAALLNGSYRPSPNLSAGSTSFRAGKRGVVRVTLTDVSEMKCGDGGRVIDNATFRWRSRYSPPNDGSIAVWLGLVVGPVMLSRLMRKKSFSLSNKL